MSQSSSKNNDVPSTSANMDPSPAVKGPGLEGILNSNDIFVSIEPMEYDLNKTPKKDNKSKKRQVYEIFNVLSKILFKGEIGEEGRKKCIGVLKIELTSANNTEEVISFFIVAISGAPTLTGICTKIDFNDIRKRLKGFWKNSRYTICESFEELESSKECIFIAPFELKRTSYKDRISSYLKDFPNRQARENFLDAIGDRMKICGKALNTGLKHKIEDLSSKNHDECSKTVHDYLKKSNWADMLKDGALEDANMLNETRDFCMFLAACGHQNGEINFCESTRDLMIEVICKMQLDTFSNILNEAISALNDSGQQQVELSMEELHHIIDYGFKRIQNPKHDDLEGADARSNEQVIKKIRSMIPVVHKGQDMPEFACMTVFALLQNINLLTVSPQTVSALMWMISYYKDLVNSIERRLEKTIFLESMNGMSQNAENDSYDVKAKAIFANTYRSILTVSALKDQTLKIAFNMLKEIGYLTLPPSEAINLYSAIYFITKEMPRALCEAEVNQIRVYKEKLSKKGEFTHEEKNGIQFFFDKISSKVLPLYGVEGRKAWKAIVRALKEKKDNDFTTRIGNFFAQCAEDNAILYLKNLLDEAEIKTLRKIRLQWWSTQINSKTRIVTHKPLCGVCQICLSDRVKTLFNLYKDHPTEPDIILTASQHD